jgi:hypothetical protein
MRLRFRKNPSRRTPRWRRWAATLGLLFLLLAADYVLYPRLSHVGGKSFNRGQNGLWLRYWWYFGQRSDAELRALARQLTERQVRYAYFHVRHITRGGMLRYHHPAAARRLVSALHRAAPAVRVIAWVYAGNLHRAPELREVDLANAAVRRRMVAEARWLVTACGFEASSGTTRTARMATRTSCACCTRRARRSRRASCSPRPCRSGCRRPSSGGAGASAPSRRWLPDATRSR